ncbi:MAG: peptidoglycan peptidase [Flavobacteriales bacterium]|nr:peptidoglycan peptidase [Flavobacteriales bacterium]
MPKRSLLLLNLLVLAGTAFGLWSLSHDGSSLSKTQNDALREGDIVFQQTGGEQGRAVQLATGSPWTHVGILFKESGRWMVYEAVGPVLSTPLDEWTAHGEDGHWVAKRWVGAEKMDAAQLRAQLHKAGARFRGLPYDLQFGWNDERIYCSELVWKMYAEGPGVELCKPKPMRDHALGSPVVQEVMRKRYGSNPPLDELMIAPGALFECTDLRTVAEH